MLRWGKVFILCEFKFQIYRMSINGVQAVGMETVDNCQQSNSEASIRQNNFSIRIKINYATNGGLTELIFKVEIMFWYASSVVN